MSEGLPQEVGVQLSPEKEAAGETESAAGLVEVPSRLSAVSGEMGRQAAG